MDQKLQTLIKLASVLNYTKTAEELSLTQPAVTHHIKQLESEFNLKIFRRSGKELVITPEGELLLKYAYKVQGLENSLYKELADKKANKQRFTVGITSTIGEYLLPTLFSEYCKKHKSTILNIYTSDVQNIMNKMAHYEIDWAILAYTPNNPEYETMLLDTDYLCLVVSPAHPFAKQKSVSLTDLKREPFVLPYANSSVRILWEQALIQKGHNINEYIINVESDNLASIKNFVAADLGVTIMSYSSCMQDVADGRLAIVPIENLTIERNINIIFRSSFASHHIFDELKALYISIKNSLAGSNIALDAD